MITTSKHLLVLFFLMILHAHLCAQEVLPNGTLVVEVKKHLKPYVGTLKDENRDTIFLQLKDQEEVIAIPRSSIVQMDAALPQNTILLKDIEKKRHRQRTSYIAQRSNFEQERGTGSFSNYYLGIVNFEYSFSKNFSLNVGGIPPLLFLSDFEVMPLWIAPKVHFSLGNDIHGGLLAVFGQGHEAGDFFDEENSGVQMYSPSVTFGRPRQHITIGVGGAKGRYDDEWTRFVTLSGATSFNRNWMLTTESFASWYPGDDYWSGMLTAGARWVGPKISIDFGLWITLDSYDIFYMPPIPYIGFSIPFGER
jgi:hypothetical protein